MIRYVSESLQLTTANQTIYTAPSDCEYAVLRFGVCNNVDGSNRTFSVYVVPSGGSAASTNQYITTVTINTLTFNSMFALTGLVMEPGDFIVVVASANSALNMRLGIMEVVE